MPGERVTLARDLSDLLVEFSLALGHQSAYPEGHPLLVTAAERLTHALAGVLARRATLTLGIAKRQFVIDGVATDPGNGLLGNLAQRFHRHRVAALRFDRGITQAEIGKLLAAIGTDPRRDPGPLGLQPESARSWTNAEIYPAQYNRLELSEEPAQDSESDSGTEVQLWLELARAALPDGTETDLAGSSHPGVLAAAINRRIKEVSYDQTVVSYLVRVAEEVAVGETVEQAWLRRRLSRLIASLDPAALERLLQVGGSEPHRRRLVLAASQTLAADAVLKVVQAAGESSSRNVSDSLMLLLGKLAQHAESGSAEVAPAAETALRENVGRLVSDWELEDPNPEAYATVLQHMVRHTRSNASVERTGAGLDLDPEAVLRIGLELGEMGPRVHAAVDRLVADGRTRLLTELLEGAAKAGAETDGIWGRVVSAPLLARELARHPLDLTVVEALVTRLKAGASDPLLDALAASEDRSTRWNLLRLLAEIGAPAATAVAARLPDTPWFVQRNLLLLLGRLGTWPEGFSPTVYISHGEPRVRREAYRLLLDAPGAREAAIVAGLADPDPGIVTMVLGAALPTCPPSAIPLLAGIAHDTARDTETRLLAVRALAGCPDPDRAGRLAGLARQRRWWGGVRLAPKSPVLLAVLKALADSFGDHPEGSAVLALASGHRDPEIRAAARARGQP
ncbi:MAG TPA: hypothetical protein VG500_06610 [Gemmatimonadales bacterium]|jgi:hypothetical protein|nr:hypothetical protein [Gemmatimonadales bacterium]